MNIEQDVDEVWSAAGINAWGRGRGNGKHGTKLRSWQREHVPLMPQWNTWVCSWDWTSRRSDASIHINLSRRVGSLDKLSSSAARDSTSVASTDACGTAELRSVLAAAAPVCTNFVLCFKNYDIKRKTQSCSSAGLELECNRIIYIIHKHVL